MATEDPRTTTPSETPANRGRRALAGLLALVLAFGAAVMIAVAIDIGGMLTCEEFLAQLNPDRAGEECFDGGSTVKTVSVALFWVSGVLGAIAVLLGLAFAFAGRFGRRFAQLAVAAVIAGGLAILIGSV